MRSRRRLSTSLAALLVVSSVQLAPARAEDSVDPVVAYREAVSRGSAQFDAGDWADARASFEAAYAIHAEPVLLFNIASCYRREGNLDVAVEKYRAFLAVSASDDPRRALAAQTIIDLEETIASRTVVPRREPEPAPAQPDAEPAPEETIIATDEDDEADPTPASMAVASRSDGGGLRSDAVLRWSGVACGVASLVTGALALSATREASNAEASLSTLAPGSAWDVDQQATFERGQDAQQRAIIYSIASAALVTTGVVLYVTGERRRRDRATTMTVAPTSDGGMVSFSKPF
jgi:tetratricopeptide (TPR) repeat protein